MSAGARPVFGGRVLLLLLLVLLTPAGQAAAQRAGVNVSGDFDYYVLALSWSPAYCELEASAADRRQCESGRAYAFIVHGLWPQYERGWPEFCPAETEQVPGEVMRGMFDLMPSEGLIRHQWRKHGTCAGLTPQGYFEATRRARERVVVPEAFKRLDRTLTVSPQAVEEEFLAANPGIGRDGMAVTCNRQLLREVRICLERYSFDFRPCPPVAERACRAASVRLPPVRGRP